ncbi:hypothetical protein LCGC14_3155850, partial [marine sediment metagenome]
MNLSNIEGASENFSQYLIENIKAPCLQQEAFVRFNNTIVIIAMTKDTKDTPDEQLTPNLDFDQIAKNPESITEESSPSVLSISTMNESLLQAAKLTVPQNLFSTFWFEGELCILFSDTNLGKSILAVQIGDSITSGKRIFNIPDRPRPQKVGYLDIELFGKQFEARYIDGLGDHYKFSDNFHRLEINPETIDEHDSLENQVLSDIESISKKNGIKVFIIDNITALITDFEKSKNAIRLMKTLNILKRREGMSFLVLAHTPKVDNTKPITQNHLAGSKALINLVDSAFAIGISITNEKTRYLKQI